MPTKSDSARNLARQIINIFAWVAVVVIAVCGATVPYNNNFLMDVVSRYNPDFMVNGFTVYIFSIVAFVFFLCFVVYQCGSKRRNEKSIRELDVPYWVIVATAIVWVFGFFYDLQWLAFVAIIIQACAVFYVFCEQGIGETRVTRKHYWCVHFPFSIFTSATMFSVIATIATFCIRYNLIWWGIGQTAWVIVAMLVWAFFFSMFMHCRPDVGFGATAVWFAAGILVYQNGHNQVVTDFALILTAYFALVTYFTCFHQPRVAKKDTK